MPDFFPEQKGETMIIIINFISAILLSLFITPLAIKMCILDKPNYRKIHDKPIPKGGGIGIFIPLIFLELNTFLFFNTAISLDANKYFTIMFVTFALLIEGIIDDKFELSSGFTAVFGSLPAYTR